MELNIPHASLTQGSTPELTFMKEHMARMWAAILDLQAQVEATQDTTVRHFKRIDSFIYRFQPEDSYSHCSFPHFQVPLILINVSGNFEWYS